MESTHCAGHTLDLIISRNSENILNSLNVVDVPISDHRLIICSLDLKKPPFEKRRIQYRQLKSVNYDNFRKDIMNSPLGPEVQHAPVDSSMNPFEVASHLVDLYDNVLLSLIDSYAPVFDTVNHKILLSRLSESFGIKGMALKWFNSYLTNRKQFVAINNAVSSVWDQNVGVPQGSVLGPILYVLYTSPVADIIKSYGLSYHFYADDSQLYITFSHNSHQQLLDAKECIERCVADIKRWMQANDLKLNQDKTEIMLIHSKFKAYIDPPIPSKLRMHAL